MPFQLNRRLNIVAVEEGEEPHPLEYEAVADAVRRDYLARHQQRLYHEVSDQVLTNARFSFYEEAVQRALD